MKILELFVWEQALREQLRDQEFQAPEQSSDTPSILYN